LGIREAEEITIDVTSKVYRKHLAKAFSGGELEMADSKAALLQNLCDELHFDPQKACKIHEGNLLYIFLVMFTVSWNFTTCSAKIPNTLSSEVIFISWFKLKFFAMVVF
jgi:hypothetical protein